MLAGATGEGGDFAWSGGAAAANRESHLVRYSFQSGRTISPVQHHN